MSTHVLDEQIDKMLQEEGMTDGMARLVSNRRAVVGSCDRLRFCHFLLALVNLGTQTFRGVIIKERIARYGSLHDIRCEEGGHHTGCYDDGIDHGIENAQAGTQSGDDERELTYLHKREAGQHGVAHRLTAPPATQGGEENHSDDNYQADIDNTHPVFRQ